MSRGIEFSDGQEIQMAQFVAELARQGVDYEVEDFIGGWKIMVLDS